MRTTIDLPEDIYRKTKATAALRGSSMKDLILKAIEREISRPTKVKDPNYRVKLPIIDLKTARKIDLTGFDFDDLLT